MIGPPRNLVSFDANKDGQEKSPSRTINFTQFVFLIDIAFDVDDVLDINELRGTGLQPGEEELPDLEEQPRNGNLSLKKMIFLNSEL